MTERNRSNRRGSSRRVAEPALRMDGVSRAYSTPGGPVPILRGVSLDVASGDFLVITGRSGAGKSTMLHLMGLMDAPDAGKVLHQGRDLSRASEIERGRERLAGIGFVFQHFYLVPTLSAARNVMLPLKAAGVSDAVRAARVKELLEATGLADRGDHLPHELSGGQQQLVAVARALANRPYLVLADEPTGELDEESGARVVALLSLAREEGAAVVMVTHAPASAPPAARRLRLDGGMLS